VSYAGLIINWVSCRPFYFIPPSRFFLGIPTFSNSLSVAGTEKAIVFLGKTFVVDKAYNSLKEAIAGSKRDVDLGMAVLIAPEANQFNVWVSIPNEMILQSA
jgi:hypothetical protein